MEVRLAAGGYKAVIPARVTFDSIMFGETVHIMFTIAILNALK